MVETPSIAIVGAGAIGCYYGARLALDGRDVRFLARGDFDALREHGITLRERDGVRLAKPVSVFKSPAEIGPVDLVIVALKSTTNASLPGLLPPLLHERTAVLTLQNGLGNEEFIAGLVGGARVLGGLCFMGVTRTAPGELTGFRTPGVVALGEFERPLGECGRVIGAMFERAGVRPRLAESLAEARWQKLVWNVPFNGLAIAHGGITTDRILASASLAREVRGLMDEIATAAHALGHTITEEFIRGQIDLTPPMGAYRPSSLVDFLAGREVEVEAIWGEPLRRAQAAGVAMPRLEKLYGELLAQTKR